MDGARLSPFPHLSWLRFRVGAPIGLPRLTVSMRGAMHTISLTVRGRQTVRWIRRGRETCWTEEAGTVHFNPADGDEHTFETTMSPDFESAVLMLPRRHLHHCLASDGLDAPSDLQRFLTQDDAVLRSCLERLAVRPDAWEGEEAARMLVMRLAALHGGRRPAWWLDDGIFDRATVRRLVAHVDAHLRGTPSLVDMALVTGLSPSHFARKFRATTGLSLKRFVHRRRVRAAAALLTADDAPLATMAARLGFCTQSHFTYVFRKLTGMTPARFRARFGRVAGP
jgi:AraC-like DNA-binding protein